MREVYFGVSIGKLSRTETFRAAKYRGGLRWCGTGWAGVNSSAIHCTWTIASKELASTLSIVRITGLSLDCVIGSQEVGRRARLKESQEGACRWMPVGDDENFWTGSGNRRPRNDV